MKTYTAEELQQIISSHKNWLNDEEGGVRANLVRANLDGANLYGANLDGANLDGANLVRANLDGANLDGANLVRAGSLNSVTGNMKNIKSIACEDWPVAYTSTHMQIGCQKHLISEWWEFDDATIREMSGGALNFWKKWMPIIKQIIELSPAEPTGYIEENKDA